MANVGAHSTDSASAPTAAWTRLRATQPSDQPPRPPLWDMAANLRLLVRLAARLLWQARGLAVAVALGMLLTVVTLCAAPALTAASAILTVRANLGEAAPSDRNVETYVTSTAPSPAAHARIAGQVTSAGTKTLGGLSDPQPTAYAVSAPLLLAQIGQHSQNGGAASAEQVGVQLEGWDFATVASQMRFLAGGPPAPATPGQPTQVIITQQMATDLHLRVGSTLTVAQFGRFSAPDAGLALVVSGIWEPRQANAPFWNGATFLGAPAGSLAMVYPVLASTSAFYTAMARFPGLSVTQYWVYYTRVASLTPQMLASASGAISRLRSDLETATLHLPTVTDVGVITQLDHLTTALQAQLQQMSLPVKGLLMLLAALACVFVAITSQALSDATARALVNLRSRGASGAQLLSMVGLQATLLAALALALGPPLALLGVWGLVAAGVAGTTSGMSLGDIALGATPAALALWAGVGALVGVGATLVGARSTIGETSASFARRQGRAESASRRAAPRTVFALLVIALLALVGALELIQFAPQEATGVSSSLLVMAAPALILLSGALLAARLAPVVASWALAIGLRRRGITLALAMAPLVRGTARFAKMALLTTLALGLACFALVFRASLLGAQTSATSYAVGSDARITQRAAETQGFDTRLLDAYSQLPGIQAVAPVYRTQETTPAAEGALPVETLAIDPARFTAVASDVSWRADFAVQSLPTLMSLLARPVPIVAGASAPWVIVSASYATRFDTQVGDHLTLLLSETSSAPMTFTVAAIAQAFPTLAAQGSDGAAGFVVVSIADFSAALAAQQGTTTSPIGPNEFWARMTAPGVADQALRRLYATTPQLDIDHLTLLSDVRAASELSPVGAGMRALLLLSAFAALALAALGALIQTLAAARRERVRFAILRTLGLSQRTLTLLPLQEVLLTQALGLLVGSAIGAILIFAVAPLLGMIEAASAPILGGGPPIQTLIPWPDFIALAGALLLLTLFVVRVSVWRLTRMNLNRELRISED